MKFKHDGKQYLYASGQQVLHVANGKSWSRVGWHKLPTEELEALRNKVDDSTYLWESMTEELHLRGECNRDSRVAQAMGCNFGDQPS